MGLFGKIKAYLNEEEPVLEDSADGEETKSAEEAPADGSAGEQSDGEEAPAKKNWFSRFKRKAKDEDTDGQQDAHAKHVEFDEEKNVQDFCEQLIDVSAHMEEIKNEYRVVTEYLTDIQRIEELPVEMANDINATAQLVVQLGADRQTYLQSEKLLPMDQYNTLANYEDEVLDTIKRLNEMEMRDSMLKSDMGHLEGEKESLKYLRVDGSDSIERLRGVIITILVLFLLTSGGLFVYAAATRHAVTMYALIVGAVAMISFAIAYVRYTDLKKEVKEADAKINRAISLLNKVKVKYINNINTIEYIYRKFGVNSCKELEYRYELYQTMVRDEKRRDRADNDLRVQQDYLQKKLERIGVRDTAVWLNQPSAFVDRRELTQIKEGLLDRREGLRKRMAISERIRDNANTALRAALSGNPGFLEMITEILSPYGLSVPQ